MQIVIELSDEEYEDIINSEDCGLHRLTRAIANGIELPKGHGDIVDIETLCNMFWDGNSMEITKYDLSVIDPIIKADMESEEV